MANLARSVNRDDLARAFGGNQRLILAFEGLLDNVAGALPDAVSEVREVLARVEVEAGQTSAQGRRAEAAAGVVAAALDRLSAAMLTQRSDRSELVALRRRIDQLEALTLGT